MTTPIVESTSERLGPPPVAEPAAAALGPVKPGERIAEMDILRGFALLGICVINLQSFLGPYGLNGDQPAFPAWYDRAADFLINLFGSGKFNAMFSFLFGVGFAIQLDRATTKNAPFVGMYLRRLAALFLFGLAHIVFLWDGDVLHLYAAIGLPLILFRNLRDRWLWLIVVLCIVVPIARFAIGAALGERPSRTPLQSYERQVEALQTFGKGTYTVQAFVDPEAKKAAEKAGTTVERPPAYTVTAASTYPKVVTFRVREWLEEMRNGAMWFWPIMGTTLLIGFIAGRRRIIQDLREHLPFIRKLTIWSGAIGFAIAAIFATSILLAPHGGGNEMSPLMVLIGVAYILGRPVLCAFYMGTIILLAQHEKTRPWLQPLALVGRMPLTNYLMHSLVFSTLFYGYALGWYWRVGPAASLLIAFTLYAIQVGCSNWWMSRFRFGPMEWLWRTLTYGKPPALRPTPQAAG